MSQYNNNEYNHKTIKDALTNITDKTINGLGLKRLNYDNGGYFNSIKNKYKYDGNNDDENNIISQTARDIVDLAKKGTDVLNRPDSQEKIQNFFNLLTIAIKAGKKPFTEAVNNAIDIIDEASPKAITAFINALKAAAEGIPFVGTIIAAVNVADNVSKGVDHVVEATKETADTISDAVLETDREIKRQLRDIRNNNTISREITNRAVNSIDRFMNPVNNVPNQAQKGGKKTRRRYTGINKRYTRHRHVRFAV